MNNPEYKNANQIHEMFGIPRSMLGRMAAEGRVEVKRIEDDFGVLNLYRVSDIEKIINGGNVNGGR